MTTRAARAIARAFASVAIVIAALVPNHSRAATSAWIGDAHAKARLVTAVEAVGSGTTVDAGLEIQMAPGWHTYWRTPGDAGIPTTVDWSGSGNLASSSVDWPAPTRLTLSGLENYVYLDRVLLPMTLRLAEPGKPTRLRAAVDYAACAEVCVPYHADLALDLPAGLAAPGPEAASIAAALMRVPSALDLAGMALASVTVQPRGAKSATLVVQLRTSGPPLRQPDLFVEGLRHGSARRPLTEFKEGGALASLAVAVDGAEAPALAGARLTLTVTDGSARSAEFVATPTVAVGRDPAVPILPMMLAIALLGGLVLNFMPCVLPVLSLKLLALTGLTGDDRRSARLGLCSMAAGVLACFLALAVALIALKAAGTSIGWGIQFQQPWFLAGMAAITVLFAANQWDLLTIGVPGAVTAAALRQARHPLANAFLTGVFATLLATPCSAPFVGTAVGFALARGPAEIAAIFGALGIGLSSPYLLLAAMPGLARRLPRPGRWTIWLRRMLSLGFLGTAAWLVVVLADEAGPSAGAVTGALLAASLAVLALRAFLPASTLQHRTSGLLAALAVVTAVAAPTLTQRIARPAEAMQAFWRPFDLAEVRRNVDAGRVVFVDVTAAWCLTCKVNEAAVLDRPPVFDRLRGPGVIAMRADWTRPDPTIATFLQSFARYGVPLDVVYGPGHPEGEALPELLTPAIVTAALKSAANTASGLAVVGAGDADVRPSAPDRAAVGGTR